MEKPGAHLTLNSEMLNKFTALRVASSLNGKVPYDFNLGAFICNLINANEYFPSGKKKVMDAFLSLSDPKEITHLFVKVEDSRKKNSSNKIPLSQFNELTGREKSMRNILKLGRNMNNEVLCNLNPNGVIGRDEEINALFEILRKRFKNNPILLGHPGVGKTSIIEGIARKIVCGEAPDFFKEKIIVEISTGFLNNTSVAGELEERLSDLIRSVEDLGNIILFFDELHLLIGQGTHRGNSNDIAAMLTPAISKGLLTIIGATTYNEYQKLIEMNPSFDRRFHPMAIEELSPAHTREILYQRVDDTNRHFGINYNISNIDSIVELCDKHYKKRCFPDKALDVFERLAAKKSLRRDKEISEGDVRDVITELTGIAFPENSDEELNRLFDLENALKKSVRGQDHAIERVCSILRITKGRFDLNPTRPDGVFLFTGPTGVGKTYLAKSICRHLYGTDKNFLKLDMSEFSAEADVSKLLGSAPGLIGHDNISVLSSFIQEFPTSVILLDEIEKAHEKVIKIFLQVFDEGVLRDSRGKRLYFSAVTFIMTSNAIIKRPKPFGFSQGSSYNVNDDIVSSLSKNYPGRFPIELLNRMDEIILFNPLTKENISEILHRDILSKTKTKFASEMNISVQFTDELVDRIISSGFSEELGARQLQRTFSTMVLNPLVDFAYKNKKNASGKNIIVSCKGPGIEIGMS